VTIFRLYTVYQKYEWKLCTCSLQIVPVPVAARSKVWVCGRSPSEIVGSNPTEAWMSVCCECCVLSGRGLCDELITRLELSYRLWSVVVCDQETSRMRKPWPALGRGHLHIVTDGYWTSFRPFLLTYLPHAAVLLEKLTGSQLVKKFPAFYGNRKFITPFTNSRHLCLSWTSSIQSILPHLTAWRSILILSSHLRLGLRSGLLLSGYPTRTLYTPLLSIHTRYIPGPSGPYI